MHRRRGYSATLEIGKYPVSETAEEEEEQEQEQSLCSLLLDIIRIALCCCCCRIVKQIDESADDYESCDEMACATGDSDSEEEEYSGSDSSYIEAKGCSSNSDYDD
jgi:hypothetical protein